MDMRTEYMGLKLKNPIVVGASSLTSDMNTLHRIAGAGAGAVVIKSLFQEQEGMERFIEEERMRMYDDLHAEMVDVMPTLRDRGPQNHLFWVRKAVKELDIPVIASLNAVDLEIWVEYSKLLEGTGIAGLELNMYSTPVDHNLDSNSIELEQVRIFEAVKQAVKVPLSVKLSPFYTNPLNFMTTLDRIGVDGLVLFNRFLQPTIDTETLTPAYENDLSYKGDHKLPLRFTGIAYDHISADICGSGGIYSGQDAARLILAGASCVQMVSALYRSGVDHIRTALDDLSSWMEAKGFSSLSEFRGSMSMANSPDPEAYTRAQYMKMLRIPKKEI
ncbi:MAG: dihydroorotate dehydrogenase-like protein [Candidatus Thermoplasmatota archaeon]|nr:dihydroorotate dehydrogenase-like protein [Candidatus Thermoplasmatota archaeon]